MASVSFWSLMLIAAVVSLNKSQLHAQQPYVNNKQLDCYNTSFNSITKGYNCNGVQSSCQSYLTFRSAPPYYTTPVTIGYLLGAQASTSLLVSINNISSDVASIPANTQVIVPVNCSCHDNQYYQHNASYTLKFHTETYFTVANDTYQGLTTCQALMDQNPSGDRNLTVGLSLQVPLRCACPTSNQTSLGINYLLTYMVTWGDSLSSIAQLFGVDLQNLLDANELEPTSTIFPFTPLLVPLTTKPTNFTPAAKSPPAVSPPPQIPVSPPRDSGSSSKKWLSVGIGLGVAALVVFGLFGFLYWYRKSSKSQQPVPAPGQAKTLISESAIPPDSNSWSLSSDGLRYAIESLTVYKYSELQMATGYFSKDNRVKGSVYKGNFKGDGAAIKVMKGDVSSEINILKKINHSNIIRLSGFCVHQGNTYLVYEYAENGDLTDKIHSLTWKQRVQIAHDVAEALNYLHNYTNPPYIHKNLKTSNILLDANLRAKIGNFGLARTLETEEEGGLQLTRHVIGTQGYMAPEYIENGVVTPKLDVFAFGVVILELLSGKEAAASDDKSSSSEEMLSVTINRILEGDNVRQKFCDFMDHNLGNEYPMDLAFSLAQLAKTCVALDINARPPASQVFITLSKILSSSLDWDPSLDLHSSRSFNSSR